MRLINIHEVEEEITECQNFKETKMHWREGQALCCVEKTLGGLAVYSKDTMIAIAQLLHIPQKSPKN